MTYKILLLGARGSGKTVFLSSMYYKLSRPNDSMFFLEPYQQVMGNKLKHVFATIEDKWPPETAFAEVSEWSFACMIDTKFGKYKAFDLKYYDYAGGRLDNPTQYDGGELMAMVKDADILLGLIDGQKLIRMMENDQNDRKIREYARTAFDNTIDLIANNHQYQKPVHLIISKWDLLQNKYTLADVNKFLLNNSRFKSFVEQIKRKEAWVRLIPVSSVGFNFIDYEQSTDVVMAAKPNGQLEPFQVEYPIALALMDKLRVEYEQRLKECRQQEIETDRQIEEGRFSWKNLWGKIVKKCGIVLAHTDTLESIGRRWRAQGERIIEETEQEWKNQRDNLLKNLDKVRDEGSAFDYILQVSDSIERKLDMDYPGSKLS